MVRDGVLVGVANELAPSLAGGGINVNVATGQAFVQGFWYKNDAVKALPITANVSATPRVDLVVLHLNRTANTLIAQIHDGVVGAGAPALTQVVGGDWEILLATVSTASGVSVVTDARTWQANMYNPMTMVDDIIVADAHGNAARRAKGAANSVFGVNAAGVLGYYTFNPMTAVDDIIVGDTVANGVAPMKRVAKGAANTAFGVNAAGTLGYYTFNPMTTAGDIIIGGTVANGVAPMTRLAKGGSSTHLTVDVSGNIAWAKEAILRADANLTSNVWSASNIGATTSTFIDQNFTVASTSSIIGISTRACVQWHNASVNAIALWQININGSLIYTGPQLNQVANIDVSTITNATYWLTGLTAGTNNVKLQLVTSSANNIMYMDPASTAYRFCGMQALELLV